MFGLLAAPIISTGCVAVGVARHLLDCDNIGTGIKQVAHKSPAKIVGGEIFHAGLFGSFAQHVVDRLVSQVTAVIPISQPPKERPCFVTPNLQPVG